MNFEDPFADDLKGFGATVSSVQQRRGGGRLGADNQATLPSASLAGTGGLGTLATGPSPLGGGFIEFDIGDPAGGGRRRRGGETAAGAATGATTTSGVGSSNLPVAQPSPQAVPPATAGASPVTDVWRSPPVQPSQGVSIPTQGRRAAQTTQPAPYVAPTHAPEAMVIDDDDPLAFLGGAAPEPRALATSAATAGGQHTQPLPQGGSGGVMGGPGEVLSVEAAAAAARRAKQEEQIRDLYAQLYALEEENTKAEEKLSLQATKEEAELLTLSTSAIEKTLELANQETQLQGQCDKVKQSTQERLGGMRRRYEEELSEQEAEVRRLEGDKYHRQLKLLDTGLSEVEASLATLRQQKRLILDQEPFSPKGLQIALSTTAPASTFSLGRTTKGRSRKGTMEPRGDGVADDDDTTAVAGMGEAGKENATIPTSSDRAEDDDSAGEAELESEEEEPSDALDRSLGRAVALLKAYCDRHLTGIKDHIVDYLHEETLQVAHHTRMQNVASWADESAGRRATLGEHLQDMMARFKDLTEQRDAQKRAALQRMHEELAATTAQLRQDAAARVDRLTKEVSARLKHTSESFEAIAQEHKAHVQQKISQTIAGDMAMAREQAEEVRHRWDTEDRVRRQLRDAAKAAMEEQLTSLRAQCHADSEAAFASARAAAVEGTAQLCRPLQSQAAELRRVIDAFTARERKAQQQRQQRGWSYDGTSTGAPSDTSDLVALAMASQERESSLHALHMTVARTQEDLTIKRRQLREVYNTLGTDLEDHVKALREKRLAQQSHQSAIDFTRMAWERDHQQNLKGALHLQIPCFTEDNTRVLGQRGVFADAAPAGGEGEDSSPANTASPAAASPLIASPVHTETHAAPSDVALVALLRVVRDALFAQHQRTRKLRSRRSGLINTHQKELSHLSQVLTSLRTRWSTFLSDLSTVHNERDSLLARELAVCKERARHDAWREEAERQRTDMAAHRADVEAKTQTYAEESAAVAAAHAAAKDTLDALAQEQLRLAMEVQQRHHYQQQAQQACQRAHGTRTASATQFLRDCTNEGGLCDAATEARHSRVKKSTSASGNGHRDSLYTHGDAVTVTPLPSPLPCRTKSRTSKRNNVSTHPHHHTEDAAIAAPHHRTPQIGDGPETRDVGERSACSSNCTPPRQTRTRSVSVEARHSLPLSPSRSPPHVHATTSKDAASTAEGVAQTKRSYDAQPRDVHGDKRRIDVPSVGPSRSVPQHLAALDASPGQDTSTVSVSSFYRSGTFVDLVTLMDSTIASATDSF